MKTKNITNKKFNRLTAIKFEFIRKGHYYWRFKCDCGKIIIADKYAVIKGHTKSCGCFQKECMSKKRTIHNQSNKKIYRVWSTMKERCFNQNNKQYKNYGGRGIRVCAEWRNDFQSFYTWAINNGYKNGLTIDRIDVNGNYEPNNCRWINMTAQQRNRRNNHQITYNKETHCIREWEDILGFNKGILQNRIVALNWNINKAFTTPIKKKERKQ